MRNFIHRIIGNLFRCYAEPERSNFKFRKLGDSVLAMAYPKFVYIMRTVYTRNIIRVSTYDSTANF